MSQAMNGMNEDTRKSVYRILDASANRAGEGLRTMHKKVLEQLFKTVVF